MQRLLTREFPELTQTVAVDRPDLPAWVWEGAVPEARGEGRERRVARGRSMFFLVAGSELPGGCEDLLSRCLGKTADEAEQNVLFLLVLSYAAGKWLAPEQVKQLAKSLHVSSQGLALLGPLAGKVETGAQRADAAVVLGELCWWLHSFIQDAFCLCGGDGLLFPRGLGLDGGPVVPVDDGHVHKGKDGYRMVVWAGRDEEVPVEVLEGVAARLREQGVAVCRVRDWLRLTAVSALEAFSFHSRLHFQAGVPYLLAVSALG